MRNVKQSLTQRVRQQILERMSDGGLYGGQLISRRGMAEQLGVSMAPVAEAFITLEQDGLLETLPRQGTFVRSFTLEDARQQCILRLALEAQVARCVCGPDFADARGELIGLADRLDRRRPDGPKRWQMEIHFHRRLAEISRHDLLVQAIERSLRLGFFIAIQTAVGLDDGCRPSSQHAWLIGKLNSRDPNLAENAMRRHLLDGAIGRILQDWQK
jgi:DNA-binding GntR family transcriptional regulator